MALELVRHAARLSIFQALVLLDGMTGERLREGQFVEFALYLDLYAEEAYGRGGTPQTSVRINPILGPGEELHDLYNDLMEARKSTQE